MYGEGRSRSAIGRLLGYSATAVQGRVKRGITVLSRLRERGQQRTEGVAGRQPAAVVDCFQ